MTHTSEPKSTPDPRDPPAPIEQPEVVPPVPVKDPPSVDDTPTKEPPEGPDTVDPSIDDPRVPGQPTRKEV
jgi:hypothetical protein